MRRGCALQCFSFAVVISAAVWGRPTREMALRQPGCQHIIAKRHSKNQELMHLLRCLIFIEHSFTLSLVHIPGVNYLADDLSCDNLSSFLTKVPTRAHFQHRSLLPFWCYCSASKGTGITRLNDELHGYCWLGLAPSMNWVYLTAARRLPLLRQVEFH